MPFAWSYAIFGTFGIVSGFLTPHLSVGLRAVLPGWTIIGMPISTWLSGVAFGLALAAATACLLGFQPQQLLIIPFVLAGWFCAVQICSWIVQYVPEIAEPWSSEQYWRSLSCYFAAGAVGALLTGLGIPVATRRLLPPRTYLAIAITGALIAAAWFVLCPNAISTPRADYYYWYALFAPWQAAVAMLIGRSIISVGAKRG
jgi:hypothetical protein